MQKIKLLFVLGTRPEAIKLAPLIKACEQETTFETFVCITAQHRAMLDQVLDFFRIVPHFDLNLMQPNQSLNTLTAKALLALDEVYDQIEPDAVLVQGDTTTVLAASLSAFYRKIKIIHIEAGLRSYHKHSPFPEELNRVLTGHLADVHCCPTPKAVQHLAQENITQNVFMVGNTVVDALFLGLSILQQQGDAPFYQYFSQVDFSKKIILVTCHRRESFGEPFLDICRALRHIAQNYPDCFLVYPVHLNPNIKQVAEAELAGQPNICLLEPLAYPQLIWLMQRSFCMLTDSGGIQEEAPSLGKPILVLREVTERQEGIDAGTAFLVGTDPQRIIAQFDQVYRQPPTQAQPPFFNPYGDGTSCQQIVHILKQVLPVSLPH